MLPPWTDTVGWRTLLAGTIEMPDGWGDLLQLHGRGLDADALASPQAQC